MVEKETVLEGYDDMATAYLAERALAEDERGALASFLDGLSPDSRVLDAGCGAGEPVLRRLTEHAGEAVGLDFSAEQVTMAKSNAPGSGLLRGDMTRLPLAPMSMDAAVAFHSLIHIPADQHQSVIDEFARVLRPGGRLLLSEGPDEWEGTNPDWLDAGSEMQWHIAGADTTRTQLDSAGFQIAAEYGAPNQQADDEESWMFFEATLSGA